MSVGLLSLQTQCLTRILHHLEDYPAEWISLLPTKQRKHLLMSLPPLDICKLESSVAAVQGVDTNQVWRAICEFYDETDNLRITGNRNFDSRYLNYRKNDEEECNEDDEDSLDDDTNSSDSKNWRDHFFTRTLQMLLHSFDPSSSPVEVTHSNQCNSRNDSSETELECDCWGLGLDPSHHLVLQRLMAVPPQSNIAQKFSVMEQRSSHFKDLVLEDTHQLLLIPFRYSQYFEDNTNTSSLELLKMLVRTCQVRPKVLPVHCEYMFYSELYQLCLTTDTQERYSETWELMVEMLASVERLEFHWLGGFVVSEKMSSNPTVHIPLLFVRAVLSNAHPKLDSLYINIFSPMFPYYMPKADVCLREIAPLFSSLFAKSYTAAGGSKPLPVSAPYTKLKYIHMYCVLEQKESDEIVSSIISESQETLRGLELRCKSKSLLLEKTMEVIKDVSSHPQLEYLALRYWQVASQFGVKENFKQVFDQFLNTNCASEVSVIGADSTVVIPPPPSSSSSNAAKKKLQLFSSIVDTSLYHGVLLQWLGESAHAARTPLKSVTLQGPVSGGRESFLRPLLSTSECLVFTYKTFLPIRIKYLTDIGSNSNLETLSLNTCLPHNALTELCKTLSSLNDNGAPLKKLSLQRNLLNKAPQCEFVALFKTLFTLKRLQELSLDLRGNAFQDSHIDAVVQVWKEVANGRTLKSLTLDTPAHQAKAAILYTTLQ